MPLLSNKSRLPLSVLLLIAFFIPAYNNVSAFTFIGLAFSEAKAQTEITFIDVLILITPLIFIPVIAVVILIRSVMQVRIRKSVTGLPLLLLLFFIALLSFTGNRSTLHFPVSKLLFGMQVGFYLTAIASLLLLFTKNKRKHRRKRKTLSSQTATAVVSEEDV